MGEFAAAYRTTFGETPLARHVRNPGVWDRAEQVKTG